MKNPKIQTFEIFFFFFLVLAIFLAPYPSIAVNNNASYYLHDAGQILNGAGPEILKDGLVARGPVFVYILSAIFSIAGLSIISVFFLMKGIYACLLIVVYLTARTYCGKSAAFLAIIFLLASVRMYLTGCSIDTTGILSLLFCVFFIFFYKALQENKYKDYVLSGIFLGLAYLTKETALFYVLLVSLFFLFSFFKKRSSCYLFIILLGAFILTLVPWAVYVYQKTNSVLPLLGHFNPQFHKAYSEHIGNNIVSYFFQHLAHNFTELYSLLANMTPLAPLLVITFVIHVGRLCREIFRKEFVLPDILLTFFIVFYLPIPMSDISIGASDPRQGYIIYILLFIIAAKQISIAFNSIYKGKRISLPIISYKAGALGLVVITLSLICIFVFKRNYHLNYTLIPEIRERYTLAQKDGAQWLINNISPSTPIIVDGYLGEVLSFYTSDKLHFTEAFNVVSHLSYESKPPIVFLITYKKFRTAQSRRFFWILDEPTLLLPLSKGRIVAFSQKTKFLDQYFKKAPWVKKLYSNDDMFIYYIVSQPQPLDYFADQKNILVNENFIADLEWVSHESPQEYGQMIQFLTNNGINLRNINEGNSFSDDGLL